MFSSSSIRLALVALTVNACFAFPALSSHGSLETLRSLDKRDSCNYPGPDLSQYPTLADRLGEYIAPGPDDARGPCPALNTLSNHGLLNRNGKDISSEDVQLAIPRGFGMCFDGFATALHNWEVVCEYVMGQSCGVPENNGTYILTNITLLGEPHSFEHDHSYSRQDYKQGYGNGGVTDNIFFNSTEFQTSLDVVGYSIGQTQPSTANYQDFNEIRLQRESIQNQADFPGWFIQNIPIQLFETGFLFGATFDRDSSGNQIGEDPLVRLDWWSYWFSEESFPTQLGWVPAQTTYFDINFITSVSSAVLAQSITSTPISLPPGATVTSAPAAGNLPEADPNPTYELYAAGTDSPYAAPTPPSDIQKRALATTSGPAASSSVSSVLSSVASVAKASPSLVSSAKSVVGPAPTPIDLYQTRIDIATLNAQVAQAQTYQSNIVSAITSLHANS